MSRFFVVDPGINAGIVIVEGKSLITFANLSGRGVSWEEKTKSVAGLIGAYAFTFNIKKTFIEWPTSYFNGRGNTDSIIKLAFLIGRIVEQLEGEIILLPVTRWRGNLPKEIGWKRAQKFFQEPNLVSHCGDAAGMARWLIEKERISTCR